MKKGFLIGVLMFLSLMMVCTTSYAQSNVTAEWINGDLVYKDKSGNIISRWDGTNRQFEVPSGSAIDVESGGSLKVAGTAVTSTAAQLNRAGARILYGGTTATSANTEKSTTGIIYYGSVDIVADRTVTVSGFSPAFTDTTKFSCFITSATHDGTWKCDKTSASSITISTDSVASATDTINYLLVGY